MAKQIQNPPSAYFLMDSMRSIGYSFDSAVADIIDNSISAKCKRIRIFLSPNPFDISLSFLDDGKGMNEEELISAMRYGSKPADGQREETDLGRFGLGLKSASLSQCRKLTVATMKDGTIRAARWDLDYIEEKQSWALLMLEQDEIDFLPNILELKEQGEGTLVIWQDFDIIRQINNGKEYQGLVANVGSSAEYLGLIFHRFLSGQNKVSISVNGEQIEPIDPFLESNRKTEVGKPSDIVIPDSNGVNRHITVTTYLLPFLKDLTEEDKRKLGGVARIASMQGFYVYRNNRLIIYGTWFHMSYRNELAKYARIKVDIPASLDDIWKIDIKKQSAELPPMVRQQLQKCVEQAKFSSRRKSEHRLTIKEGDTDALWRKGLSRDKKASYRINRDAPLIREIIHSLEPSDLPKVQALLSLIEKSVPYHDMYTDEANDNISQELTEEERAQLLAQGITLYSLFQATCPQTEEEQIEKISKMDPFSKYDWFKEAFRKELAQR